MSCERYDDSIALAAGEDLDPAALARLDELDEHLKTCSRCRRVLSELRELRRDLGALGDPEVAAAGVTEAELGGSRAAVWAALDRQRSRRRNERLLAAAAALLLAIASLSVWRARTLQPETPATEARSEVRPEPATSPARLEEATPLAPPPPSPSTSPRAASSTEPSALPPRTDRLAAADSPPPTPQAAVESSAAPAPAPATDQVVVKLLANDPDLVIYWIIETDRSPDRNPIEENHDATSKAPSAV